MTSYSLSNQKKVPMISLQGTGKKLKELRIAHNFTREELGNELNCTYQAVASWENGRKTPSIDKCVTLANLYNCHIEELFDLEYFGNTLFDNTILGVHEASAEYTVDSKFVSHPSLFKEYVNYKFTLKDGKPANGIHIISNYFLNFENGYLSDQQNQYGKILKPAVYSTSNKYTEHWKDGVLHCDNGPAVINGLKHYEEWWNNGKQIKPRN